MAASRHSPPPTTSSWCRALLVCVAVVAARPAIAAGEAEAQTDTDADTEAKHEPAGPAVTALRIEPSNRDDAWRARAIAQTLARELAAVDRLDVALHPEIDLSACSDLATRAGARCAVAAHRDAGVEVVLLGVLESTQLVYEIHGAWLGSASLLGRGAIDLEGDVSERGVVELVRETIDAFDPVVGVGGALDRRDSPRRADAPARIDGAAAGGSLVAVLAGLAVFLALPLLAGMLAAGRGYRGAILRTRAARLAAIIWALLAGTAYWLVAIGDDLAGNSWLVFLAGGIAWGWFATSTLPTALTSLRGLDRVEHGNLARVLRAWTLASLQRVALVALCYAPIMAIAWALCAAFDVPTGIIVAVVLPLAGLLGRFWFLALVDALSLSLDHRFTDDPSGDHEWSDVARAYFLGYVRRAGWPAEDDLVESIRFLPGHGFDITTYGGGLTHSRIVIGTELLELALAPYERPHDYAEPRISKLHWSEWNAGLVVPVEIKGTIATPGDRMPRNAPIPGETEHQPLGEPPTLVGVVEPDGLDPRPVFHPERDPLWLDWDPGEEHDGTDPNDKDFLFGAMVRELGVIERREDQLMTVALVARRWMERLPDALYSLLGGLATIGRALVWHYPAKIADAYASLNYARHHLVQYLAWRRWGREDLLTARAYAPELERRTAEILGELERAAPGGESAGEDTGERAALRARLMWLSELSKTPVRSRRAVIVRRVALAGVGLAALGAIGVGVASALDYHPTYQERIEQERDELRETSEGNPEHGERPRGSEHPDGRDTGAAPGAPGAPGDDDVE